MRHQLGKFGQLARRSRWSIYSVTRSAKLYEFVWVCVNSAVPLEFQNALFAAFEAIRGFVYCKSVNELRLKERNTPMKKIASLILAMALFSVVSFAQTTDSGSGTTTTTTKKGKKKGKKKAAGSGTTDTTTTK